VELNRILHASSDIMSGRKFYVTLCTAGLDAVRRVGWDWLAVYYALTASWTASWTAAVFPKREGVLCEEDVMLETMDTTGVT
jgi:hypothetical protein